MSCCAVYLSLSVVISVAGVIALSILLAGTYPQVKITNCTAAWSNKTKSCVLVTPISNNLTFPYLLGQEPEYTGSRVSCSQFGHVIPCYINNRKVYPLSKLNSLKNDRIPYIIALGLACIITVAFIWIFVTTVKPLDYLRAMRYRFVSEVYESLV